MKTESSLQFHKIPQMEPDLSQLKQPTFLLVRSFVWTLQSSHERGYTLNE